MLQSAGEQLSQSVEIDEVWLEVARDAYGFVTDLGPTYTGVSETWRNGDVLTFTATFTGVVAAERDDTAYRLKIFVEAETGRLEIVEVVVLVPGR